MKVKIIQCPVSVDPIHGLEEGRIFDVIGKYGDPIGHRYTGYWVMSDICVPMMLFPHEVEVIEK